MALVSHTETLTRIERLLTGDPTRDELRDAYAEVREILAGYGDSLAAITRPVHDLLSRAVIVAFSIEQRFLELDSHEAGFAAALSTRPRLATTANKERLF